MNVIIREVELLKERDMRVNKVTVTKKGGILRIKVLIEGDEFIFGVNSDGEVDLVCWSNNYLLSRKQVAFAIARGRVKASASPHVQGSLPF